MLDYDSSRWCNLPDGLKNLPQWALAGEAGNPLISEYGKLSLSSPIDCTRWVDFETAVITAKEHNCGIGFMLTPSDPYICIDLDVCNAESQRRKGQPEDASKWTEDEVLEYHRKLLQEFASTYIETSRYGMGAHIWLEGSLSRAYKHKYAEIYTTSRFIICTGNSRNNFPIRLSSEIVDGNGVEVLKNVIRKIEDNKGAVLKRAARSELVEVAPTVEDTAVWDIIKEDPNYHQYWKLIDGDVSDYPSHSEADYALLKLICTHTASNSQCSRMFKGTKLAYNPTKQRFITDRQINLALSAVRADLAESKYLYETGSVIAGKLLKSYRNKLNGSKSNIAKIVAEIEDGGGGLATKNPLISVKGVKMLDEDPTKESESALSFPPGFAGELARFIYNSSPKPVSEVAIVGTLGMLAGICGKAFIWSDTGLNIYLILVGSSGIGKDSMHHGVSLLINAVNKRLPGVDRFVDYSKMASGPALNKALSVNDSFVSITDEWGTVIASMSGETINPAMASLKAEITKFYSKSARNMITGGSSFSDSTKNTKQMNDGVAFSLIGDSTPAKYFSSLNEDMMENGFLSRFSVVYCTADRGPTNWGKITQPPRELVEQLSALCKKAQNNLLYRARDEVAVADDVKLEMEKFDLFCDDAINATSEEGIRLIYNRATLKMMKIAGLIAVADDFRNPCITMEHYKWAHDLATRDINLMLSKMASGDIGTNDCARSLKILEICKSYLKYGAAPSYKIEKELIECGVIPRSYIQRKVILHNAFSNARCGSVTLFDRAMKNLIDNGNLIEVPPNRYKFGGKAYKILNVDL